MFPFSQQRWRKISLVNHLVNVRLKKYFASRFISPEAHPSGIFSPDILGPAMQSVLFTFWHNLIYSFRVSLKRKFYQGLQ